MMVADVSQFCVVGAMLFGVKFFRPERGMERITFKKLRSQSRFLLDISW